MANRDTQATEINHPDADPTMHPLLVAIEAAPLILISDEENAQLDQIARTTKTWLTNEEFVMASGLHLE